MPDIQRLIAEVSARHRIRVEPDDPAFALVTLNQLVLEESVQGLSERLQETISRFETSMQNAKTPHRGGVLRRSVFVLLAAVLFLSGVLVGRAIPFR